MPRAGKGLTQGYGVNHWHSQHPQEVGLLTLSSSLGSDFNRLHLKLKERLWNSLTSQFSEHAGAIT